MKRGFGVRVPKAGGRSSPAPASETRPAPPDTHGFGGKGANVDRSAWRDDQDAQARIPTPPPGPSIPGTGGGRLFIVATPIGNLQDWSPRAAETLRRVALVLAEDTRHARKLLTHFGISSPTQALHEHNEPRVVPSLVARLQRGEDLALVSDAGTPVLSDPGFRLVRACREAAIPVLVVPGPSAVAAAVAVSGLPPTPFTFVGFLPPKAGPRTRFLEELARIPHTLVCFISPHRLADELGACGEVLGVGREAALCSELTKLHERCRRGTLGELAAWARDGDTRGEHTLVIGPPEPEASGEIGFEQARQALAEALEGGVSLAEARRVAARRLGISRRQLFALVHSGRSDPGAQS